MKNIQGDVLKASVIIGLPLVLAFTFASASSAKGFSKTGSSNRQTESETPKPPPSQQEKRPPPIEPVKIHQEEKRGIFVTSEYEGISTLLLSLSKAKSSEARLANVNPETWDKIPSPKERLSLAAKQLDQIQLGVNDLLDAKDTLPQFDHWGGPNNLAASSLETLTDAYRRLIADYLDLLSGYNSKLFDRRSKKDKPLPAQQGKSVGNKPGKHSELPGSSRTSGKNLGNLLKQKSIEQVWADIGKAWDAIRQSEIAIAKSLVNRSGTDTRARLLLTASERSDLLSTIDSLFPELDEKTSAGRSKVAGGIIAVRNVLREVPTR